MPDLDAIFRSALELDADADVAALAYGAHDHWDSVGHMVLVNELEEAFDLVLDTDDVLGLSSYAAALELLARHGVVLPA